MGDTPPRINLFAFAATPPAIIWAINRVIYFLLEYTSAYNRMSFKP